MKEGEGFLISVVVPVYNEAENIQPCLRGLWSALRDIPHEILICYDQERDTTLLAIEKMLDRPPTVRLVKNELGRGVACALRAGFQAAQGDVVVSFMADLSDSPEVILAMAEEIRLRGAQVVSGSRYMKGGRQIGGPRIKGILSRLAGLSLHWLAKMGTHDVTTNFRAYSAEFLRQVTVESIQGFEVGLELTVKAHLLGLKIAEVPSTWRDRTVGQSRFQLRSWLPHYLHWYLKCISPALLRGMMFAAGLVYLLLTMVSWRPVQPVPHLDYSWNIVFHYAFETQKQFGKEIIFTYGPYGFVSGPLLYAASSLYYPATFHWVLMIQSFFCLTIILAWRHLISLYVPKGWQTLAFFPLLIFVLLEIPIVLVVLLSIFLWKKEKTSWHWIVVLLTTALALASLIKFTYFLLSLFLFALFSIEEVFRRRRVPWLSLIFCLSFLVFWVFAGQKINGLFPYIWNSIRIASGYTEGMVWWEWGTPIPLFYFFFAAIGILLALLGGTGWEEKRVWGMLPAVFLGCIGFLIFKYGFVLHDNYHEMIVFLAAPALVILYLPSLWARIRQRAYKILLLGALVISFINPGFWDYFSDKLKAIPLNISASYLILAGKSRLKDEYAKRQKGIARRFPFPEPKGSVDLYSYDQIFLIARSWKYTPRPIIQSYAAYSPVLAEINARHLRGPNAPDNVFFSVQPLSNRYPSLDDNLSWIELLAHYDVCETVGQYLRLQKNGRPRSLEKVHVAQIMGQFGREVFVPETDKGPIWAEIDIRPTLFNRVVSFFYKAPLPTITVNGESQFKLLPSLARSGFLLSPFIPDARAFETLAVDPLNGMSIRSFRVDAEKERYYHPEIGIRLFRLKYPAQQTLASRLFEGSRDIRWRLGNGKNLETGFKPVEKVSVGRKNDEIVFRCTGSGSSMLLPRIPLNNCSYIVMKAEVTSPSVSVVSLSYSPENSPSFSRRIGYRLVPGRNMVFLAIPAGNLNERLRLQMEGLPGEYFLHSFEVRGAKS